MARPERRSNATTKTFADRLSDLVEEKKKIGLSQKEIAAQIGVSSGTLSEWCSDNKTPMIDALPKLANYFAVSTDYLLGLTDIHSRNETLQGIHEKIGLSQTAISRLMVDRDLNDTPYLPFLNQLIESGHLSDLSALVTSYTNTDSSECIRLDMIPVSDGVEDYQFQASAFLKAVLTEYFFQIIEDK